MTLFKITAATIGLLALANPALAAGCATPTDVAALKTAVMQQELMVAALQCRESRAYNRFVMAYRGELQSSDAALKAFFVKRGGEHGEAGYDTFKTKAANLSGLEQARDSRAFCADAHALFTAAASHNGTLASFVESRSAPLPLGGICAESKPIVVRTAAIKPVPEPARAVPVAEVKIARADTAIAVPEHSLPTAPWRRERDAAPPPRAPEPEAADNDTDDDDADYAQPATEEYHAPPPRPRAYQIRQRDYDPPPRWNDRRYGPPRDWRDSDYYPPPRGRWYPRDDYYGGW